ncbi:glycosyltransferase [Granulicella sp. 5B5]|nr:glycosyltransferase [Granulicella sp. 5B5]
MRPDSGGPQEAVRMMLRSAPDGCDSEVLTLDDPQAGYLQAAPFTVHALGGDCKGAYSAKLVPWLRANRNRYDGVVLHGMWEYLSLAVLRTVAGHVPYLVFAHGMLDPYFKRASRIKHMKKWLYWLPVQYWVLRHALRVVFTTEAERGLAAQSFWLHRWNAAVIGLGADAPSADVAECREAFYALCPALRDKQYLLFLGRLDPKKGCDLLIEAFARVALLQPDVQLVMAGPDSAGWQSKLQRMAERAGIAERVHWPGMLKGERKWGAFAGCEAFVLPSHQENFGIAVVEALACGKPVLITQPINIAEDLAADGCALVDDDTLEGVISLLTQWTGLSPAEREAMSARALQSATTRYDMRKNTSALVELLADARAAQTSALAEPRKA